jgi:hypothetical protein
VIKAGRVIARTPARRTALFLDQRPALVDPAADVSSQKRFDIGM